MPKSKKSVARRKVSTKAGANNQRPEPKSPMPAQHQEAPNYKGANKLAGKVALITGGDSGIGRAVAVLFAREGADVAITYLAEEEDAKATQAAVEAEGRRAILIPGDVSDPKYAEAAVARTVKDLGGLDILVN